MRYTEEIREIRKMINEGVEYNDNFAHKRTDEELQDYVSYLSTKNTGLSKDILVDTGENYKFYNHPLCIYVVADDKETVYPVIVSEKPFSPTGVEVPSDILLFVMRSTKFLKEAADVVIGTDVFFDYIEEYREQLKSTRMVGEMTNMPPQLTGLPVWVYVDDTKSYLTSGHNGSYRIKFQQDKSLSSPRMWMPMLIPSLEIMNNGKLPPIKISQKAVNNVKMWAKGNLELLERLKTGEIDGEYFRKNAKTLKTVKILLSSETET